MAELRRGPCLRRSRGRADSELYLPIVMQFYIVMFLDYICQFLFLLIETKPWSLRPRRYPLATSVLAELGKGTICLCLAVFGLETIRQRPSPPRSFLAHHHPSTLNSLRPSVSSLLLSFLHAHYRNVRHTRFCRSLFRPCHQGSSRRLYSRYPRSCTGQFLMPGWQPDAGYLLLSPVPNCHPQLDRHERPSVQRYCRPQRRCLW